MNISHNFTDKRRIDLVYLLIIFFIVLISALSLYLVKVNDTINSDIKYKKALSELNLINKDFENFFFKSTTFNNYDNINKKIKKFENIIKFLEQKNKHNLFSSEYETLINNVKKDFVYKKHVIESFKSQNALLIGSLHYLVNLNDTISSKKLLGINDIFILDETLTKIMLFYINTTYESKNIKKNINYLYELNKKKNLNELKMFIIHTKNDVKSIEKLSKIKNQEYLLKSSIKNLEMFLSEKFKTVIYNGRIIVIILFAVAFIVLFTLLFMYKRSLRIKDELISFTTAVENSYNSIVITDTDNDIIYVNDTVLKETGYDRSELIGQNPRILKSGNKPDLFYKEMHENLRNGKKWEGEFVNKRKDGTEFYEKASIIPITHDGEIVSFLAIKLNITDYILQQEKVKHMAYHDSLTSLPNRANIEEYLEANMPMAKRNNTDMAILFIDIDNFKTINDTLGHDVGDGFIKECSKILKNSIRKSDILARVGGDEFVIVLQTLDSDHNANKVCESIISQFQEPIQTKSAKLNITMSIGVSMFPDDAEDYITLFKYADLAMYKAKENGKNNFQFYSKNLSSNISGRLDIEQALKHSVENQEIYTMYQPKYELKTQRIVGFEALARWENEKLGLVPPDKFIPISENTNDIIYIGLYVFKKACEDFLEFKKIDDNIDYMSINISTVQLYQDQFVDDIIKIVKDVGIDASSIMLEITETHIMKNISHSLLALNKMKELGFCISIDDFGTGYSSLSYLKRFPINELKIDKSFVDDLPSDPNDTAISKAIISMSKNMGYKNVAEGIETKEQEDFLLEIGCEIGQGYLFCKPKKKDELIVFLKEYTV